MTHTEEFNKIMNGYKSARKNKKQIRIFTHIKPQKNMNPLQESISKCTINGNIVNLPIEKINNYPDLRNAFLKAGAKYKNNTFIFPSNAEPYITRLMDGEKINLKKEYQFFATPSHLANKLVEMANINNSDLTILEPSGGQGAIIKAILHNQPDLLVHTFELMEINHNVLEKIKDCIVLGRDFLNIEYFMNFDRIIANPPFSKNQDIEHITKMYKHLNLGGRLVTIASKHWQLSNGKKEIAFRKWLNEVDATIENIPANEFKDSGTLIETVIITINK